MILRILETVSLPGVGCFSPGARVNIPKETAVEWVANGQAMSCGGKSYTPAANKMAAPSENKEDAVPPAVIPPGQYCCSKCKTLHRETSKTGKKHLQFKV